MLLLAACGDDSRVVTAQVQVRGGAPRALSDRQLQVLNRWMADHEAEWSRLILATPPPSSALTVSLQRQSGEKSSIAFYSEEGWKSSLMYWGSEPGRNRQGRFPADEVSALRRELEKTQ